MYLKTSLTLLTLSMVIPIPCLAQTVVVAPGDTLSRIAAKHQVPIQKLIELNGLRDSNQLKAGSRLKLPNNFNSSAIKRSAKHKVQSGETISSISTKYKISKRDLIRMNRLGNINHLYIGQTLNLPQSITDNSKSQLIYKVRRGDTLAKIARTNNIRENQLIALNELKDSSLIYPGQNLRLRGEKNNTLKPHHIVRRGETLTSIAKQNHSDVHTLMQYNEIKNPYKLIPGTKLSLVEKVENNSINRKASTLSSQTQKVQTEWRRYGPLKVAWSNWQEMGGSYVTPSFNSEGKALYLAVNCFVKRLNATGANGAWKKWSPPIEKFEHNLIKDVCRINQT